MGNLLLTAYDAIKSNGYTGSSGHVAGSTGLGLVEMIDCLRNDHSINESFNNETIRALITRLSILRNNPLFSEKPTSIKKLLSPGKARILLMGHLSPELRSVVAALITRQIFKMRSIASEASKLIKLNKEISETQRKKANLVLENAPPRTLICIDEAQGYAPPSKSNPCTEVLIQYVKEGRNHGLSLMVTSQQPSGLHAELLSQMDATIAHRLTVAPDIDATIKNAKARFPKKIMIGQDELNDAELLRELTQGQALISHADASRYFISQIRPRITAHGGIEG
jgi:hypothetical protein